MQESIVFFPSICPETFSYVVSEIMQFDMPIIAFRIGAQGENVERYAKGILVDSIQEMKDAIQDDDY